MVNTASKRGFTPQYEWIEALYRKNYAQEAKGLIGTGAIKWNFTKFLVDRNRGVVARFAPAAPKELEKEIKNCFNSRAAGCVAARGIRTTNKSSIV